MKKVIENIKFMQDGTMVFGDLYLEDGYVQRIDYKTPKISSDLAVPGFVDIHTHGFCGISCDEIDANKLKELAISYAKRGTTSFCPTISARSLKEYAKILDVYREVFQGEGKGAQYCGAYLEGPYLNPKKCGNMDVSKFKKIDIIELDEFLGKYHEDIRVMTIAPELELAQEAIRILRLYGVKVALGHTDATYEQTMGAFDAGASQVTHFCNTMPRFDHHTKTMMDAVLLSDCLCEIIFDGIHIQPKMLEWLLKLLGSERIIAISDGKYTSGMKYPEGYTFEDGRVVRGNAIYQEDTLISSCIDMLDIFRYLYKQYDLMECITMCSLNGAKMLKNYTGEISLGKKVDLVILDSELQIKSVIVNGRSAV